MITSRRHIFSSPSGSLPGLYGGDMLRFYDKQTGEEVALCDAVSCSVNPVYYAPNRGTKFTVDSFSSPSFGNTRVFGPGQTVSFKASLSPSKLTDAQTGTETGPFFIFPLPASSNSTKGAIGVKGEYDVLKKVQDMLKAAAKCHSQVEIGVPDDSVGAVPPPPPGGANGAAATGGVSVPPDPTDKSGVTDTSRVLGKDIIPALPLAPLKPMPVPPPQQQPMAPVQLPPNPVTDKSKVTQKPGVPNNKQAPSYVWDGRPKNKIDRAPLVPAQTYNPTPTPAQRPVPGFKKPGWGLYEYGEGNEDVWDDKNNNPIGTPVDFGAWIDFLFAALGLPEFGEAGIDPLKAAELAAKAAEKIVKEIEEEKRKAREKAAQKNQQQSSPSQKPPPQKPTPPQKPQNQSQNNNPQPAISTTEEIWLEDKKGRLIDNRRVPKSDLYPSKGLYTGQPNGRYRTGPRYNEGNISSETRIYGRNSTGNYYDTGQPPYYYVK